MSALIGLYRLLLNQQLTRGRLILAAIMSALTILVAVLISSSVADADRIEATVRFLSNFGLGLMVPILSLVLASSALGQLVEDETLVYLWIRPTPRWMLAAGAWLAASTVAAPLSVIPLTAAALIGSGADSGTTIAIALSMTLAVVAYTGIFTLIGLILKRSLIWGLVYIFIWEFFVARVGEGAARLSINTYPASVLARMTEFDLESADRAMTSGLVVPIVVALVAVAITGWRLDNANVA